MKIGLLLAMVLWASALAARANNDTYIEYNFTPANGYTLSNIFIADIVPQEDFTFFFNIGAGAVPVLMGSGSDAQYVALFATFTGTNGQTDVAISMPTSVAGTVIADDESYAQFNSNYSLEGPGSESELASYLSSGETYQLEDTFSYIQASSGALNTAVYNESTPGSTPDVTGEIVGFDDPYDVGSLTYYTTTVPEPTASASMLAAGIFGSLFLSRRRLGGRKPPD